ncbi:MAG: hypothetical protein AB1801_18495, partial [Chloroflexota bacterium]
MATCPNCGTNNKEGAPFCANCRKPLPKKIKRISTPSPTVEHIPNWLTLLLAKYGETSGPLAGLTADTFPPQLEQLPPELPEDVELSALLDQMAEQSPSRLTEERLSTSVEWGAFGEAAEPPPPPIDNLLAGIGVEQDYAPYARPPAAAPETGEIEIPDWLSESPPAAPAAPQPTYEPEAEADYNIPAWLSGEAAPAEESTYSPEIPDWLTETAAEAPPESPPPASRPATSEQGAVEVPDWLLDELERPAQTAPLKSPPPRPPEAAQPAGVEPEPPFPAESPDWLDELPAIGVEPAEADEAELPAQDLPDWLSEMPGPTADKPEMGLAPGETEDEWSIPDWIATEIAAEEEAAPVEPGAIPDWISSAGEETAPAAAAPDWLTEIGPAATAGTEDVTADDWLANLDLAPAEEGERPSPETLPPLDTGWLADLDSQLADETASPADEAAFLPDTDWLRDFDLEAGESKLDFVTKTPDVLEDELPPPAAESPEETQAGPQPVSKLKRLKPFPQEPQEPAPPESSGPTSLPGSTLPDWAAGLVPPGAETPAGAATPPLPDWAQSLVPPAFQTEPPPGVAEPSPAPVLPEPGLTEAEAEGPVDWIAQFAQAQPFSKEPAAESDWLPDESAIEDEQAVSQRLDWLLAPAAGEAATPPRPPAEIAAAAEVVDEPVEAEELLIPDWLQADLAELPPLEETSTPVAAEETPAWLAQISEFPVEEEPAPAWLAELPGAAPPAIEAAEAGETPDWLAEIPGLPAEEELETPEWLLEPLEMPPAEETPDWEAELPAERPQPSPAEAVSEAPDWLAELTAAPAEEIVPPPAIEPAEEELPAWLRELPAVPVEETAAPPLVTEEEEEAPAWLQELPAASAEEAEVPPLVAAEETELPAWLRELPPLEETAAPPVVTGEEEEAP